VPSVENFNFYKNCCIWQHVSSVGTLSELQTWTIFRTFKLLGSFHTLIYPWRPCIAQGVSCRLPTAAARVRSQVRSCGICGRQSGIGAGFLRVLRFPLSILIPPTAPHSSIIRGWCNRPNIGPRNKWTQSHLTPINKKILALKEKLLQCIQCRSGSIRNKGGTSEVSSFFSFLGLDETESTCYVGKYSAYCTSLGW
jgi:hypothetical protein